MTIKSRVRKLEQKQPDEDGIHKIVFVEFVSGETDDTAGRAIIVDGSQINREDDEPKDAFLQRAYKACVEAHGLDCKPVQSHSMQDREVLAASRDPKTALKLYEQTETERSSQ